MSHLKGRVLSSFVIAQVSLAGACASEEQDHSNLPALGDGIEEGRTAAGQQTTMQKGLHLAGIDPDVAAANGFRVVTYADGSQQAIPTDPNDPERQPSPIVGPEQDNRRTVFDEKFGNCGWSFIEADQTGPHTIWIRSGFHVNEQAVGVRWTIELQDENGFSYQGYTGEIDPGADWHDWWEPITQYGWSSQDVLTSSYALLWWGGICTSGGPGIFWHVSY